LVAAGIIKNVGSAAERLSGVAEFASSAGLRPWAFPLMFI
jgi:hypothetical protein